MYTSEEHMNRENKYKIEQLENKVIILEKRIDYNLKKFEKCQSDNIKLFWGIIIPLAILTDSFLEKLLPKYGIDPSVLSYIPWLWFLYIVIKATISVWKNTSNKN